MKQANLILEDGTVIKGRSFGFEKYNHGEVVFNTGMTGYNETFTDPSYTGQILVMTYPLIGNYGSPKPVYQNGLIANYESEKINISGLIVSQYSEKYNHWDARESLAQFLKRNKVPAITGVDTRKLTKKLREKGVMLGKITFGSLKDLKKIKFIDPNQEDLVFKVSPKEPIVYQNKKKANKKAKKILVLHCGMKASIVHNFLKQGVECKVVPYNYDIRKEKFDGLFISNGPGDPDKNRETIKNVAWAIKQDFPIFGICLGQQILALASGAKTFKMKYGHRSQNQPCVEVGTNRCYLTSQNHGFSIDEKSLKKEWKPWFINANDGTVEGLQHKSGRFFSVQFHPEATPGPEDTGWLFDKFVKLL
jgi:carbamoyl-phosphate synthase small subunit